MTRWCHVKVPYSWSTVTNEYSWSHTPPSSWPRLLHWDWPRWTWWKLIQALQHAGFIRAHTHTGFLFWVNSAGKLLVSGLIQCEWVHRRNGLVCFSEWLHAESCQQPAMFLYLWIHSVCLCDTRYTQWQDWSNRPQPMLTFSPMYTYELMSSWQCKSGHFRWSYSTLPHPNPKL